MRLEEVVRVGEIVTIIIISAALIVRFATQNQRILELERRMDRVVDFIVSKYHDVKI